MSTEAQKPESFHFARMALPAIPPHQKWTCSNGCGDCKVIEIANDYCLATKGTRKGGLVVGRLGHSDFRSECCGEPLELWDELLQDFIMWKLVPYGHPDDIAVDKLAAAMKEKLAKAREQGRSGWDDKTACKAEYLQKALVHHVAKGDPVDVANFAMMLFNRQEPTAIKTLPMTPDAEHTLNMYIGDSFVFLGQQKITWLETPEKLDGHELIQQLEKAIKCIEILAGHRQAFSEKTEPEKMAEPPHYTWRVGEFWSSARPGHKVIMLAANPREIVDYGLHKDFIRWIDQPQRHEGKRPVIARIYHGAPGHVALRYAHESAPTGEGWEELKTWSLVRVSDHPDAPIAIQPAQTAGESNDDEKDEAAHY